MTPVKPPTIPFRLERSGREYKLVKSAWVQHALRHGDMSASEAAKQPWFLRRGKKWVNVGQCFETETTLTERAKMIISGERTEQSPRQWLDKMSAACREAGMEPSKILDAVNSWMVDQHERLSVKTGSQLTLGEYITEYLKASRSASKNSVVNALRVIVRQALREPGAKVGPNPDGVLLSAVTGEMVHAYRSALDRQCDDDGADEERAAQILRSGRSMHQQARSAFAPQVRMDLCRRAGWTLPPGIEAFCSASPWGRLAAPEYRPADDALIARTLTAIQARAADDPGVYRAVLLALGAGLRKSEIASVTVGDFRDVDGQFVVEIPGTTKNGQVRPRVIVTNTYLGTPCGDLIRAELAGRDPAEHWLPGSPTERTETVFRRVSDVMRELGWKSQKTMHEWRAYAGCQVAMRDGLTEASMWLRHSSVDLTKRFYGRYLRSRVTVVTAPIKIA